MLVGLTQPRSEGAGDAWQHDPSSGEFWGRVQANAGKPESADVAAARDAQGTRPPRLPDTDAAEQRTPSLTTVAAPRAVAPRPRIETAAPAAAPLPRAAARPWSAQTVEETSLAPARPATPTPQQRPSGAPYEATAGFIERIERAVNAPPAAAAPIATATPAPAPAPAPVSSTPGAPDPGAFERQLQAQGMGRRVLSDAELLSIREAMAGEPPDQAPRVNPLQAYPFRGSGDIPAGERAGESVTDRWLGYHPRNRVTAREIIAEVDRLLAERASVPAAPAPERRSEAPYDANAALLARIEGYIGASSRPAEPAQPAAAADAEALRPWIGGSAADPH